MSAPIPVDVTGLAYWRVRFRPSVLDEERIASSRECLGILESIAVRAGGWRYPFAQRNGDGVAIRDDHAEVTVDSRDFREFARLYRSGQFLYVTVLREAFHQGTLDEAREMAEYGGSRKSNPPTGGVNIVRLMRLVSVAFENSRLLIERLNVKEPIVLSLKLANVRGHVLVTGGSDRELDEMHQAPEDAIEFTRTYNPDDVRVNSRALARELAREFFAAFGWTDPVEVVLTGMQEEALR